MRGQRSKILHTWVVKAGGAGVGKGVGTGVGEGVGLGVGLGVGDGVGLHRHTKSGICSARGPCPDHSRPFVTYQQTPANQSTELMYTSGVANKAN